MGNDSDEECSFSLTRSLFRRAGQAHVLPSQEELLAERIRCMFCEDHTDGGGCGAEAGAHDTPSMQHNNAFDDMVAGACGFLGPVDHPHHIPDSVIE